MAFLEMTTPPDGKIWQITLVKINMGKLLNPKLYFYINIFFYYY